MAISIISANLNIVGNNGNFETDRSTWGIPDPYPNLLARGGAFGWPAKKDNFYCVFATVGDGANLSNIVFAKWNHNYATTKKYQVLAWVKVDAFELSDNLDHFVINIDGLDPTFQVTQNFGDALAGWVQLEARFTVPINFASTLRAYISGLQADESGATGNDARGIFVDAFGVYEYIDVVDVCTLDIDSAGTVVINESAPGANDGSITIATTGSVDTLEYSIDGGAHWQFSNMFAGLASGIYTITVREESHITCNASQSFAVNSAAYDFDFTTIITGETVLGASDGRVEVTVTGDVAPFTFSLDAGATFQGSNIFTDKAPGVYTLVVKDAGGITRARNITIDAGILVFEKIYWSKNPIPFSVQAPSDWASRTNLRMYCEVQTEDVDGSGIFVSKLKQGLYPSSSGECLFNLRQAMRSIFDLQPPEVNSSAIVKLTDRVKKYRVRTGIMEDDELVPTDFINSNPFLVLYGGLSAYAHAISYFFGNLPTTKKFLTWQPIEKIVNKGQEDYLNFFIYSIDTTTIKLRAKIYYDDGTNTTNILLTQADVKYGELYQLPAGCANAGIDLIDASKTVIKYELSLLDQTDSLISEVRSYLLNVATHPLSRYLMIINSLGAHEVHLLTGAAKKDNKISKDIIQKYLPPVYDALAGQFKTTEPTFQSKTNYSTGYIKGKYSEEWMAYFTDLLLTTQAFETIGSNRFPLAIITDTITEEEDHNFEKFIRFDALNSYQDPAYTP